MKTTMDTQHIGLICKFSELYLFLFILKELAEGLLLLLQTY